MTPADIPGVCTCFWSNADTRYWCGEHGLRLVYGPMLQAAQLTVNLCRWMRAPDGPHDVAVQLGKAGVPFEDLPLALRLVQDIAESGRHYNPNSWSPGALLAAAEFVGTMNALGCLEYSGSAFRAAQNVVTA